VPPGFEYAQGIEIIHCRFQAYHASGCQDNAGKEPRIAMIREIGFRARSLYDYHDCLVWRSFFGVIMSSTDMFISRCASSGVVTSQYASPLRPHSLRGVCCDRPVPLVRNLKRLGQVPRSFSESGHASKSEDEAFLSLLVYRFNYHSQVFGGVKGSGGARSLAGIKLGTTGMFEFQARCGQTGPFIFARRLACRCSPCRAVMRGGAPVLNVCVIIQATGLFSKHSVVHKKTLSLNATALKKTQDKEDRKRSTSLKIAALVAAASVLRSHPELAPNPTAAILADSLVPECDPMSPEADRLRTDAAFLRFYGAADAQEVALSQGEGEFMIQEVDEEWDEEGGE
jgi:hypothetical protein